MTVTTMQDLRLTHNQLRTNCEEMEPQFDRSDELASGPPYIGQQRAIDAIQLGIQVDQDGYNVFVLGPPGSHRHRIAEDLAREKADVSAAPSDWCYVHNFSTPERPRALSFSAGRGAEFRDDMGGLIEELQLAVPAAFEGDDYRNHLKAIEADTQQELEEHWGAFERRAAEHGISVLETPTGYVLAPVRKGKVLGDDEFAKLPEKEREDVQEAIRRLGEDLQIHIDFIPKLRKRHRERVKALNRDIAEHAVGVLLAELHAKYADLATVVAYLDEVQRDIVENMHDFREPEPSPLPFISRNGPRSFHRYEVNLIVGNDPDGRPQVLYESNPNYANLVGRVEHRAEMGALVTDFRMIRAGALLSANGGYLLLDIHRVLSRPFAWEALKGALSEKCVRIESPGESYGFVSTTSLQPEPIPLDVKVILIGERWLYYLLSAYDSEFNELFKVAADLDDDLTRTEQHVSGYVRLIADRANERNLLPLSRSAVARVIEQRSRDADDGERLSMHIRSLDDLLVQANHCARQRGADVVEPADVVGAVKQQRQRLNRSQLKIREAIERDTLLIDTDGSRTGQVNGLSVVQLAEFRFGHPVRITATTRIGTGDVVDIEREVELGGAIHSKGMMILSAALSARYSRELPLSLNGSVVFEQSYGGVEGDSASVAELSALLSSLAGVPIKQNLAVTGSINQFGRVQAVGGINEKIEGFFDICKARGLDGTQGVIIPRSNVKHLMLDDEVVDAVRNGKFDVYAVEDIDEAITILTDTEAGARGEDGEFPEGTLNRKVEQQLVQYASLRRHFSLEAAQEQDNGNGRA